MGNLKTGLFGYIMTVMQVDSSDKPSLQNEKLPTFLFDCLIYLWIDLLNIDQFVSH